MIRSEATTRDFFAATLIMTLCCGSAVYVPVFGFISFFVLPLPVMVYRIRLGRHPGWAIPSLTLIIITVLAGGMNPDTWLMTGMLAQGFLLGECVENNFPFEKAIALSSGIVLVCGFLFLTVIGNFAGTSGISLISEYLRKNLEMTAAIYRQLEVPEENIRILTESLDQIHYVLIRIMPALVASGLVFAAWMNLLLGRLALRKISLPEPSYGSLNTWNAPDWLVWCVIGCALMLFVPVPLVRFTGWNGMIVLAMVYLFQGLGIVSFLFERKKVPLFLRVMIYGIIALQQILLILVISIGFFDTWINFRRLGMGNPEHPST